MIVWAIIAGKKGNYWQARQVALWQDTLLSFLKNHCLASGEIVLMFISFIQEGLRSCESKVVKKCDMLAQNTAENLILINLHKFPALCVPNCVKGSVRESAGQ